jgi:hypothetical protein
MSLADSQILGQHILHSCGKDIVDIHIFDTHASHSNTPLKFIFIMSAPYLLARFIRSSIVSLSREAILPELLSDLFQHLCSKAIDLRLSLRNLLLAL